MRATIVVLAASLPILAGCGGAETRTEPGEASRDVAEDPGRPLPSPLPEIAARVNGEDIPFFRLLPLARAELQALPDEEQEARMPEVVRRALSTYVDRELLFQEATRRGVTADKRTLNWAYDQARAQHPEDWGRFLAEQGMDEKSFRTELRVQHTVAALLEAVAREAPREEQEQAGRALLERLRAEARIETFL
jgi:hypothetical protein